MTALNFPHGGRRLEPSVTLAAAGLLAAGALWSRQFVRRRRHTRAAMEFAHQVLALLTDSLSYEATISRLPSLAVPNVADWCLVDIVNEAGHLHRAAQAASDPRKLIVLEQLNLLNADNKDLGIASVVRTGRSCLYEHVTRRALARAVPQSHVLVLLQKLGVRSIMIVPIRGHSSPLGAIVFGASTGRRTFNTRDLSIARQLGELAGLALDNARLYREKCDALAARDELLSVVSHELKAPVASLKLRLQSAARRADALPFGLSTQDPRVANDLSVANQQADRLSLLVENLFDVARIRSGRLNIEPEHVDLADLVRDTLQRLAMAISEAGCSITLRIEGVVTGEWDRLRLEQVVTNLITNAIKYGRSAPIDVRVFGDEACARLSVQDGGIGISAEALAHIFDRFERGAASTDFRGLGLGLYIVKQIVDAHGGRVYATSSLGSGSTFYVELPRAMAPRRASSPC